MRAALLGLLVAALAPGCGGSGPARPPEGSLAFSAGGVQAEQPARVVPGPAFRRPGLLVPGADPAWQSAWLDKTREAPALTGATVGFRAGLSVLMAAPAALIFWPAAAAVVGGAAVLGATGALAEGDASAQRMSPPDRQVIAQATATMQAHRRLRESLALALARRTGGAWPGVPQAPAHGPDTGAAFLAEAKRRGLDGLLECSLEAIGLAAGPDRETYGVFAQVRLRALDGGDGRLRYERVLSYGPGRPVEGLPPAEIYTIEMLAMDQGRVYRHLAAETLRRMAGLLAADPALPLAP
ncbi:MAG: hypothetical protein ACE147_12590 [Candidatus Methylomirabilales bacterium]